jgi:Protein of unknown function (DUF642)/PEP-CTERM motif
MRTHQKVAMVLATALAAAGGARANDLLNGSFEQGTHTNDGNNTETFAAGATDITGWTTTGSHVSWIEDPNPFVLTAQDGSRFLDLTGYTAGAPFGGVTQTITTTPGAAYVLTFELGSYTARWGGPPVSILASAGGTSHTFTNSAATTASTWSLETLDFTATGTSTAITLQGSEGFNYIGLDNVDVECASSGGCKSSGGGGGTGVPEPATLSLLGLGLAALGLRRRRSSPAM